MAFSEKIPRLSRLTSILLKLQARPFVGVREMAEAFGVSKRTIYRDLIALEEAGVPLVVEEGRGYGLVDGYVIPPVMFTESEANALIVAEKMIARTKDASLISEFGKAIEKIKSVLDHEEQEKADFLAERTIIGTNWGNERTSSHLSDIQKALTHHQALKISYLKAGAETPTERIVEPFAIYHNTSEQWVLIAWCRLREDFRSFRLDRMVSLRLLAETFAPHKMSLAEYVEIQRIRHHKRNVT